MEDLNHLPLKTLWDKYISIPNIPNKLTLDSVEDLYDIPNNLIFVDDTTDEYETARNLFKKKLIKDINKSFPLKTEISFINPPSDENNNNDNLNEKPTDPDLLKPTDNNDNTINENNNIDTTDDLSEFLEPGVEIKIPFGETREFKDSHKGLTYNEYVAKTKYSPDKIEKLKDSLFNNKTNEWFIDFQQFNTTALNEITPYLKDWFEQKLAKLDYTKYLFSFKVGDLWKSTPMKPEIFHQLQKSLSEGSLIYNMDVMPTWEYDSDKKYQMPEWSLFSAIRIIPIKHVIANTDNGGHFFNWLNNSPQFQDVNEYFKRLQIFDTLTITNEQQEEIQRPELEDCCFIYALKQTGKFSESRLNAMRLKIKRRYLAEKELNKLCEEENIKVIITRINDESETKNKSSRVRNTKTDTNKQERFLGIRDATAENTFYMFLYDHHYFIDERTPFTKDYIEHIDSVSPDYSHKRLKGQVWSHISDPSRYLRTHNLVRKWFEQGRFTPMTFANSAILSTALYDNVKNQDYPLTITNADNVFRRITPKKTEDDKPINHPTFYSDFEADTTGDFHKPFMNVLQSSKGKTWIFKGSKCAEKLLDTLPNFAVCYFHNLAYDWTMFNRLGQVDDITKKGNKIYQVRMTYKGKNLIFKDSLPIFMCKLEALPKAFNLQNIQKELFPYNYYTFQRLKSNVGVISEAGKYEIEPWTPKQYEQFKDNIDKIPNCRLSEDTFDMYKYCEFYCVQDVRILREAFEALCQGFKDEFKLDVKQYLTTPALANAFFQQTTYYPNHNLYEVGGHVRMFMSRAITGGRCMCAYNKKWHTTKKIYDYDAVSLYPSAMRRLWTVEGIAEELMVPNPEMIYSSMPDYLQKYNTLNGTGAFVIEIKILKANKHYAFPLICQHTKTGNNYIDKFDEPIFMTLDNIALEDLIEFQQIEFQVIKGYVWNGNRDYRIQETIEKVFNSRLKYKAEHNPLEQLYKLIMNSSYGKTIQKPPEITFNWLDNKIKDKNGATDYERFVYKNYYKITEIIELPDCPKMIIKMKKPIDDHFNFSLLGIQILSMSKRIMNEVMCLGFDIGCHIYYQDTDSIHIEADDLPRLEEAFKQKYNRPLRGKSMGQFHSDFPTINNHEEIPHSIESYFVMKKLYVDKLQDSTGEIDYMIRGKGLTQKSIEYKAKENEGIMNLYKKLYDGEIIEFDLTQGQPAFEFTKTMKMKTKIKFNRKVKTTYEAGDREQYFNYAN